MDKIEVTKSLASMESNLRMLARRVESAKDLTQLKAEIFNLATLQITLVELLKKA